MAVLFRRIVYLMDPALSTRPPTDTGDAVSVLLPLPLIAPYDYLVPSMEIEPGSYVEVPLGTRRATGCLGSGAGDVDPQKLREISTLIDLLPCPKTCVCSSTGWRDTHWRDLAACA